MKIGNRASLEAIQRKIEDVEFPEFETYYRLREMSGTERDDYEIAALKKTSNGTGKTTHEVEMKFLRARLVALCLVDESGERIYGDKQIKECSELPQGVLLKLYTAANKLNGLEPEAVKEAEKNSASDPEISSASGSLSDSAKPLLNS